jgi:FKBP-type peptidyl-prolyl cis-trans isomerase FkpA
MKQKINRNIPGCIGPDKETFMKIITILAILLWGGILSSQEPADLVIEDKVVGTGTDAVVGKKVTVHYSGFLTNGTMFDSSIPRKTPFSFILGAGEVIQGWDRGVVGMKVGGKRKLTIPSKFGYGARGAGNVIPPNSTLIFDVELLKVEK